MDSDLPEPRDRSGPLDSSVSRRTLIRSAAFGGATLMAGPLLSATAAAATRGTRAAAGSSASEQSSDEEYVLVGFITTIDYWKGPKAGLEAAGRDLGVKVTFTGSDTADVQAQVDTINQVVQRNPAGLIVLPVDTLAVQDAIGNAIAAGIPVITTEQGYLEGGRELGYIGFDRRVAAARGAQIIADGVQGPGTVAALVYDPSAQAMREGVEGFTSAMQSLAPDLKVIVGVDKGDPEAGTSVAAQLLQANPDLKAFMSIDTSGGPAAARALKEAGRTDVMVVAGGLTEHNNEVWPLIEDGSIKAGILNNAFLENYLAVQFLYNLNRNAIAGMDWRAYPSVRVVPQNTDVGSFVIDQSNLDAVSGIK